MQSTALNRIKPCCRALSIWRKLPRDRRTYRQTSASPFEVSTNTRSESRKEIRNSFRPNMTLLANCYQPTYPRMVALKHEIEKQKMAEDSQRARIENLKTQMALCRSRDPTAE